MIASDFLADGLGRWWARLPIVRDHLLAAKAAGKEVGVDSAAVADSRKMANTH